MAKPAMKPSAHSDYIRSPRPGGNGELAEAAPGVMICIHILRPMARGKKQEAKPRQDDGHE